jgi:hypothetical protein
MTTFQSKFAIGDKVHVDDDTSITCHVNGVLFRSADHEVEISWWNSGSLNSQFVHHGRLAPAKAPK